MQFGVNRGRWGQEGLRCGPRCTRRTLMDFNKTQFNKRPSAFEHCPLMVERSGRWPAKFPRLRVTFLTRKLFFGPTSGSALPKRSDSNLSAAEFEKRTAGQRVDLFIEASKKLIYDFSSFLSNSNGLEQICGFRLY